MCSLSAPAASSSQRRAPIKKAQVNVKAEGDVMTSQTELGSQGEADMQTVAAVLSEGPSIAKEVEDAAVPLVDRLAGKQQGKAISVITSCHCPCCTVHHEYMNIRAAFHRLWQNLCYRPCDIITQLCLPPVYLLCKQVYMLVYTGNCTQLIQAFIPSSVPPCQQTLLSRSYDRAESRVKQVTEQQAIVQCCYFNSSC